MKKPLYVAFENFWADDDIIFNHYFRSTHYFLNFKYDVKLAIKEDMAPNVVFRSIFGDIERERKWSDIPHILLVHEPITSQQLKTAVCDYMITFDDDIDPAIPHIARIPYWVYRMYDYAYYFGFDRDCDIEGRPVGANVGFDEMVEFINTRQSMIDKDHIRQKDSIPEALKIVKSHFEPSADAKQISYIQTKAVPYREQLVELFRDSGFKVHSAGRLNNNIADPVLKSLMLATAEGRQSLLQKMIFMSMYPFSFAMENTPKMRGYVTEKLIDSYVAGTIPLYSGTLVPSDGFNPLAFENVADYNFPQIFVDNVKHLANNPEKYEAVFKRPLFTEYPDHYKPEAILAYYEDMIDGRAHLPKTT